MGGMGQSSGMGSGGHVRPRWRSMGGKGGGGWCGRYGRWWLEWEVWEEVVVWAEAVGGGGD